MKRLDNKKAFTLIELLVVIAILGVLVLLAAPRFLGQTEEALYTSLVHDARLIQDASSRYYLDNGEFPYLLNESGEKTLIGPNGLFEILYKVEDFDDDNMDVNFYEIDFEKLDSYVQVNNDHGYFVAAVGNPDFGITALEPGDKLTQERLTNTKDNDEGNGIEGDYGIILVEEEIANKVNEYTTWNYDNLGPEVFDRDTNTFIRIDTEKVYEVTWEEDLTNNMITVVMANGYHWGSSPSATMVILDKNGEQLEFINADNDNIMSSFNIKVHSTKTKRTLNFIMPADAQSLKFTSSGRDAGYLYEIKDSKQKELPKSIRVMSSEISEDSVALNWGEHKGDFDRVVIYRDGKFIGYSSSNEYVDTPVYSDKDYIYTIQTIDEHGNRSEKTHYRVRTSKPQVVWKGLSPAAFDRDESTFVRIPTNQGLYATWEGNLDNKEINVVMANGYHWGSSPGITMRVYDKEDVQLGFKDIDKNETLSELKISVHAKSVKREFNFVMPKNADRLEFVSSGAEQGYVYTVKVKD